MPKSKSESLTASDKQAGNRCGNCGKPCNDGGSHGNFCTNPEEEA